MADREYHRTIEKYRRQRQKLREFLEYVDSEKNDFFKDLVIIDKTL